MSAKLVAATPFARRRDAMAFWTSGETARAACAGSILERVAEGTGGLVVRSVT
jgi:hypothetical protein